MDSSAVDDFVQCLVKSLCLKFSQKEDVTPGDKFCIGLSEFSRYFQEDVLEEMYKIPCEVIDSVDLFVHFLNSVCSDICKTDVKEPDERKFFVMCGFITILLELCFSIPCYRVIQDVKNVLIFQLKTNLSLNLDSEVKVAFENLEGNCLYLSSRKHWIRHQLVKLKKFMPKAMGSCGVKVYHPNVKSRLLYLSEFGNPPSANGDSRQNEPCSFCSTNCKAILETFLN